MYKWADRPLGDSILFRLKNLLGVFIAAVLYFVIAYHLTNLYITENPRCRAIHPARWRRSTRACSGSYKSALAACCRWLLLYHPVDRKIPWLDRHCLAAGDHRRSGTDVCHHHWWPGLSNGNVSRQGSVRAHSLMASSAAIRRACPRSSSASVALHWHLPRHLSVSGYCASCRSVSLMRPLIPITRPGKPDKSPPGRCCWLQTPSDRLPCPVC